MVSIHCGHVLASDLILCSLVVFQLFFNSTTAIVHERLVKSQVDFIVYDCSLRPCYACRYPDFKPPTSPSPSAPTVSPSTSAVEIDTGSSNGPAQLPVSDRPEDGQHLPEPKSRPLSPYTM